MKILIPLKRSDDLNELIPYIEKVARPGMTAVFLVRYPVSGLRGLREDPDTALAAEEGMRLARYYDWEDNLQRARRHLSRISEPLSGRGIEVAVELYAGSLTNAIKQHTAKGDVHLIMTRAGIAQRIIAFLNGSSSLFELFKRPGFWPALLIQPKR